MRDKAFRIASDPKYDGYQRILAPMVYKLFDKKSRGSGMANEPNYQLADELHKSIGKYNKGNKYLLCAIDLFSKYVWVAPLKDKKGTRIVKAFQKIISEGRKSNKIWVDQGSEFYNNSFKDFLKVKTLKCIQHTMKQSLLLLRDLL